MTDTAFKLRALCLRSTQISETGFAVDLRAETALWHRLVSALGRRSAYRLAAETLCRAYWERYGRDFLFSESCLTFEIAYHADAYFWTQGCGHHGRHLTTLLFSRDKLARHCEVIDISTSDTAIFKQRLMFGYAAGVRALYRGTEADPFRRLPLGLARRKK